MGEEDTSSQPKIPCVDLLELIDPDRATRQRAVSAIAEAFGTYGLVYVANHGVDLSVRDRLFERFVRFTERSTEEKQPLNAGAVWYQRGWTPPNIERAVVAGGQPDFKECYFAAPVPTDPSCRLQYPEIFADNVWPEGDPGFRDDYVNLGMQIHEAGLSVLSGVAESIGLHRRWFDNRLEGAAHLLRLLRYLPLTEAQIAEGVLWGEEHTDFNLLTVLPGGGFLDPAGAPCERPDDGSGLYLRTRSGEMVLGRPPEGCVVAQVGQQLEILTGGRLLATPHVITTAKSPGYTRVSGAHFLHLHPHQMVFPLERFRTPETVQAYSPPVLAGTYGIKTLVDIGLAPPDAIDELGYRHYGRLAGIRAEEAGSSADVVT